MASLYRRHRPRTFADVVGQEHVVRTLSNAIEQGRVHHAYLFVGSRGTGKTSMAKILAASLNCVHGPTITPCGVCDSCRAIATATSLDVIEMDAASNNSVDDIRDLREKVAYAPVSGRHKVYILDEAHMLSPQAWNAFLKTLEEPPPHTIFVLATTEAQKVLPTVVDRCHRFDFARPTIAQIAGVLRRVADAEGIELPDEACALVARSATGSFRDALGTLEQLVAYSGTTIALDDVLAVLGAADADLVFGTMDAIASADVREALLAAARLADSGRDVGRFFSDLEAHARGLMVVQALGGAVPPELRVTPEQDERLAAQAARVAPADVVRLLDLLAAGLRAMKDGSDARIQLELALVKAASPEHDRSTTALLARIERLEARLAGQPSGPSLPPPGAPPAEPQPAPGRPVLETRPHAPEGGRGPQTAAAREAAASAAQAAARGEGAAAVTVAATPDARSVTTTVAVVEPGEAVGAGDAPAVTVAAATLDLDGLAGAWPAVLGAIEVESPRLAAALAVAQPAALVDRELTLAWAAPHSFMKSSAEKQADRERLIEAIRAVTGASLRLAFELRTGVELVAAGVEPALSEEDLVARFVAEFDAEELPPDDPPDHEKDH